MRNHPHVIMGHEGRELPLRPKQVSAPRVVYITPPFASFEKGGREATGENTPFPPFLLLYLPLLSAPVRFSLVRMAGLGGGGGDAAPLHSNERTNEQWVWPPPLSLSTSSFLLPPSFTSFLSHFSLLLSPLSPYVYLPRSPGAREAGKGASPAKKRRASTVGA